MSCECFLIFLETHTVERARVRIYLCVLPQSLTYVLDIEWLRHREKKKEKKEKSIDHDSREDAISRVRVKS